MGDARLTDGDSSLPQVLFFPPILLGTDTFAKCLDEALFVCCLQEDDQHLEETIAEALACPCVDDLRSGPCGKAFEASFSCFLRHHAKDKVHYHSTNWCQWLFLAAAPH